MSLVNKMLKDLEARQRPGAGNVVRGSVYEDLRPAATHAVRGRTLAWLLIPVAAALIATGLFVRHRWLVPVHAVSTSDLSGPQRTVAVVASHSAVQRRSGARRAPASGAGPRHESAQRRKSVSVEKARAKAADHRHRAGAQRPALIAVAATGRMAADRPPLAAASSDRVAQDQRFEKRVIPLTSAQITENTYRRSENLLAQGHPGRARDVLRSALLADPENVSARELLAALLLEQGRQSDAARVLAQGLVLLPQQAGFIYLLARIDAARGATTEAVTLLSRGLPGAGSDANYLALLATLEQRAGKNDEAISLFRRALALRPLDGAWWIGLGISLEAEKQWSSAQQAYSRATLTRLDPVLQRYAAERLHAIRWR